jgi:hypothetical protein
VLEYKIKWVGWPISSCTWEPTKNLVHVKEMLKEFEERNRSNMPPMPVGLEDELRRKGRKKGDSRSKDKSKESMGVKLEQSKSKAVAKNPPKKQTPPKKRVSTRSKAEKEPPKVIDLSEDSDREGVEVSPL